MKTEAPSRPKKKRQPEAICGRCGQMVERPCKSRREADECREWGGSLRGSDVAQSATSGHNEERFARGSR